MQYSVTHDEIYREAITGIMEEANAAMSQTVPDPSGATEQVRVGGTDEAPVMQTRPVMIPNPALYPSPEAYMIARSGDLARSYKQQWDTRIRPPAQPEQPLPSPTGQVLEIAKWKALVGLEQDGLTATVNAFIASLSPQAQALWNASASIQRSSPLFAVAKQHLGWTDAQIDNMFTRYSQITLADVSA
jgi:hypothetical protein